MAITYIAIHHTGGVVGDPYRSTANVGAEGVNKAHRDRPDWQGYHAHRSQMGKYGGYNFYLDPVTLDITQFRAIGEETLAQRGYNKTAVSICVGGNYTIDPDTGQSVDPMTPRIERALAALVYKITEHPEQFKTVPGVEINIKPRNVHPHRWFQESTECYGNALHDGWIARVLTEHRETNDLVTQLKLTRKLLELYRRLYALIKKRNAQQQTLAAGHELSCAGVLDLNH